MQSPIIIKSIPTQIVNERSAYGPFDLREYIQSPDGSLLKFTAMLKNGNGLPRGMICTQEGLLTGIPAQDTAGNYDVLVSAENDAGNVDCEFAMLIKPNMANETAGNDYLDRIKAQVWEALEHQLPLPDVGAMLDRAVTPLDIYYLLERWGVLTIWDAFNLDPPNPKELLQLEGVSPHYNVYDRGSCLVAAPKNLFSHERTLRDALDTSKALAREVYRRGWTIELAGFDKMVRAAWIEIQHQGDLHGKRLEIINFSPTPDDVKVYTAEAMNKSPAPGE